MTHKCDVLHVPRLIATNREQLQNSVILWRRREDEVDELAVLHCFSTQNPKSSHFTVLRRCSAPCDIEGRITMRRSHVFGPGGFLQVLFRDRSSARAFLIGCSRLFLLLRMWLNAKAWMALTLTRRMAGGYCLIPCLRSCLVGAVRFLHRSEAITLLHPDPVRIDTGIASRFPNPMSVV